MAMMAYRSSRQESTGQTPYLMLFGREIDMPVDVVYGRPAPEELPEDTTAYVEQLRETLEEAHELARRSTGQSSARQKRNYDHRSRGSNYQMGDAVWLFRPLVAKGRSKKLRRPWCGPPSADRGETTEHSRSGWWHAPLERCRGVVHQASVSSVKPEAIDPGGRLERDVPISGG